MLPPIDGVVSRNIVGRDVNRHVGICSSEDKSLSPTGFEGLLRPVSE